MHARRWNSHSHRGGWGGELAEAPSPLDVPLSAWRVSVGAKAGVWEAQPTLRARLDVAGELGSLSLTSLKERLCALLELEPALVNVTAGEGEAEGTSDGEGEGDGPSAELCIEVTCVSPDTLLLSASATRLHALPLPSEVAQPAPS